MSCRIVLLVSCQYNENVSFSCQFIWFQCDPAECFFYGGQTDVVCKLESFQNSTADVSISTLKMEAICTSETSRTVIRLENQKVKRKMYHVVRQIWLWKKQSISRAHVAVSIILTGDTVCLLIFACWCITPNHKGTITTFPCTWWQTP